MFRNFDKSYFLLVYPVLRSYFPWLQFRVAAVSVVPFIVLWLLIQFAKRNAPSTLPVRKLWLNFTLLSVVVVLYKMMPFFYGFSADSGRVHFSWYQFCAEMAMNYFFLFVTCISFTRNKIREMKFLLFVFMFAFCMTGVGSYMFGSEIETGAARLTVGLRGEGHEFDHLFEQSIIGMAGLAGYGMTYVYSVMAPAFIFGALRVPSKWMKVACLFTFLALLFNIKAGGLSTPVFIVIVGCCLILIAFKKGTIRSLVVGLVMAYSVLIFTLNPKVLSFLAPVMDSAAAMTEHPIYKARFLSMAETLRGDQNTYAFARFRLQKDSLDAFSSAPLTGGGGKAMVGGHSELLDYLAYFGISAFVLYFLFFFYYLRFMKCLCPFVFGRKWLVLPYAYAGTYFFASIANPIPFAMGPIYIVFPALALFMPSDNMSRKKCMEYRYM